MNEFSTDLPQERYYDSMDDELKQRAHLRSSSFQPPTGFSSPAEDFFEQSLDLNRLLIRHPAATYFLLVNGSRLLEIGIASGDLVLVDRSLALKEQRVIVAHLAGELVLRQVRQAREPLVLVTGPHDQAPLVIGPDDPFTVWGVVTHVIHPLLSAFPHHTRGQTP